MANTSNDEIGIITEQGDLGFFNPLNDQDQEVYSESKERHDDDKNK